MVHAVSPQVMPLFGPDGYDLTFAELGETVKNTMSQYYPLGVVKEQEK